MPELPDAISKISRASNGRQVGSTPKKSQEAESLWLLHSCRCSKAWRNNRYTCSICVCAAESLLKSGLIDRDSRAGLRSCKGGFRVGHKGPAGSFRSCAEAN